MPARRARLRAMTQVVALYSSKGGVGKTSAAVNLAWLSAASGGRTLLWDLDPQGAATWLLGVKPKVKGGVAGLVEGRRELAAAVRDTDVERLEVIPSDSTYRSMELELVDEKRPTRRLRKLLKPVLSDYDTVLLDCPPSVSLVSDNVLEAADLVLVPLMPSALSLRTLDQTLASLDDVKRRPQVRAFLSMVDRRRTLHRRLLETLPAERAEVLDVAVPAASAVEQMGETRRPVVVSEPASTAARAYRDLWHAVRG
jgi:chromosome partitioning protein